ncbi:MAG: tRNA (adenosine(37)-N6)-threonylcarbamoyltransferase complex transferase subunit TsaD [Planctomycetaceae bacterium]|jgi:N6-L-threonylcarbamoyladenine synthase|nr:tRNA (adenosine(37)-N6)-threonylcarbamoyltransferase complex transferase subunit TsaD [Planctomycetaceae bacterium]
MLKILTIETTCDETAAAVVTDTLEVLGAMVASQDEFHQRFGGVVPEIASRAHLERILPIIDATLNKANISLQELDAVSVANRPGLAGALLVGLAAAKSLCLAIGKPLIAINHLQGHIYACRVAWAEKYAKNQTLSNNEHCDIFPCVGLIVSGGHTNLYRCQSPIDFELLGSTIDDAAGEAFDKVASMLGLPYPGGPAIQRAAANGDPKAYRFPRAFLDAPERLDFSFSGLKTAVRYKIAGQGQVDFSQIQLSEKEIADFAASFQEAAVDSLVGKTIHALQKTRMTTLCIGGGVAANIRFREKMEIAAKKQKIRLHIAPLHLCTDNAVMGAIAIERYHAKLFEPLDIDVHPT